MSFSESDLKRAIGEALAERDKAERDAVPLESHVDHVVGCKDCYEGVIKKANKTMKYACIDCGLPLPESMVGEGTPACPNCGSEDAKENEQRDMDVVERMMRIGGVK